jgi:3-keto-disaccharide hydrolase
MSQLNSSWAGTGQIDCQDGVYILKNSEGSLKYNHLLKDFELSFDVQFSGDVSGLLLFELLDSKIKTGQVKENRVLTQGLVIFRNEVQVQQEKDIKILNGKNSLISGWNQIAIKLKGQQIKYFLNHQQIASWQITENGLKHLLFRWNNPNRTMKIKNLKLIETGFASLFNGKDFSGWSGAGKPAELCWKVEKGVLEGLKSKGPYLRSDKEYDDFSFRLEYKVEQGANSGVFIRVPKNGNHHRKYLKELSAGYEVQVLDDNAKKYKNLREYQFGASLYDIMGANKLVGKLVGEWNSLEIICKENRVITIHNGVKVVDADGEQYPLMVLRRKSGFLGLQNHGGGVSFRNLRIGPPILAP